MNTAETVWSTASRNAWMSPAGIQVTFSGSGANGARYFSL